MNCVNYSLVYLFAPWDSRDSNIPLFRKLFGGIYTDYNAIWFNDVGTLICSSMLFNMFYPLIEFFLFWPLRLLARAWDKRSCSCKKLKEGVTNAKTMYEYESIYSGPIFAIHWKYAYILNVVYVTFLFGPGLPILFPIAFLSLFVLYMVEKLMLAYAY